jgi:serine/threonine protein kinase
MILLSEGQNFPPKYRLVRKLKDSAADESWIAVSETTGDRVFVTILKALLSETAWQQTTKRIDALRGLVHLNISLVSAYGEADDCHYMVEPLINAAEPFSSTCNWSTLKQIIEAIDYSHKLGISHGHLHPSNLLVDSEGVVHITGYGKPITATANTTQAAYMSPEIQNQHPADISDDIYSLGGLVFYHLTNMHWADDVQLDVPLAKNIDAIIRRMTSPFPYDRHVELTQLIQVLETQFQQDTFHDRNSPGLQKFRRWWLSRPDPGGQFQPTEC